MEITPEIKKQLAEQKKQCIHCKLISGEMEGVKKVFSDDKTISMVDIFPVVKGHCTYMLKEHYPLPAYVSGEEFKHKFSLIPGLCASMKKAMVRTGINIYIAMGGAAGQQSSHFLLHLLPREKGDGFFNFLFKGKAENILDEKSWKMLANNMPIMMGNHFKRNPASWHIGKGDVPNYLEEIYNGCKIIYEDEKVLCVLANNSIAKGHLIVYSKTEEKYIEKMSQEDSAHLFFTASFASTAVFEGLGAHGSNIILKSGESDDNPDGRLEVHIIPRWQEDGLKLSWESKQASYDLDSVMNKIKDKTWEIKYGGEEKVNSEKVESLIPKKEPIRLIKSKKTKNSSVDSKEEIRKAIEKVKG